MSEEDREFLLEQAARCRKLLKSATDEQMAAMLEMMARQYEERAASAEEDKKS